MKPFSLFLSASILLTWPCRAQTPRGLEGLTTEELLENTKSATPSVAQAAERELARTGHEPTIRLHLELLKAGDHERPSAFMDRRAVGPRTFSYLFEALPSASFDPLPGEIYETSRAPAISLGMVITEAIKEGDFPQDTLVWAERTWQKIRKAWSQDRRVVPAEAFEELGWWWEHNQEAVKAGRLQDATWLPIMETSPRVRQWLEQAEKGDAAMKLAAEKQLVKAGHEPTMLRLMAALPDTAPGTSVLEAPESMSIRTLPVLIRELPRTPLAVAAPAAGDAVSPAPPQVRVTRIILSTMETELRFPKETQGWRKRLREALDATEPADYRHAIPGICRTLQEWWDANGEMIRYDRPQDAVWLCKMEEEQRMRALLKEAESDEQTKRTDAEYALISSGHVPTIDRLARELVENNRDGSSLASLPHAYHHLNVLEVAHRWLPKGSLERPPVESDVIRAPSKVMLGKLFLENIRYESRFPALTRRWAGKAVMDVLYVGPHRPKEEIDAAFQRIDEWWEHNKAAVKAGKPQEAKWLPQMTDAGR